MSYTNSKINQSSLFYKTGGGGEFLALNEVAHVKILPDILPHAYIQPYCPISHMLKYDLTGETKCVKM